MAFRFIQLDVIIVVCSLYATPRPRYVSHGTAIGVDVTLCPDVTLLEGRGFEEQRNLEKIEENREEKMFSVLLKT